ncbi:MAG: RNHCP domain-containing protein [Rickettsiales bacterium]|jgi:rubrerythrin|nr:RNHCP domain-containing protein [Rickettsiales bacterium]
MVKVFQKKVENFICENCGEKVSGNGYTNHCPKCLYSKHVDINPGDRLCECMGLMKPIDLEQKNGKFIIVHKCVNCGFIRKNKVCENDDIFSMILKN